MNHVRGRVSSVHMCKTGKENDKNDPYKCVKSRDGETGNIPIRFAILCIL